MPLIWSAVGAGCRMASLTLCQQVMLILQHSETHKCFKIKLYIRQRDMWSEGGVKLYGLEAYFQVPL